MKTTRFLFIVMSCATLRHGISYADPSTQASEHPPAESRQKHQTDGQQSPNKPDDSRASDKSETGSHVRVTMPTPKHHPGENRPAQATKKTAASTVNLHQPGSSKPVGAAKDSLVQNKTGYNHALPVRAPSALPTAGPSVNNVRHRGPSPAIVGGLANSTGHTAAVNGTGMNRKP